MIILPAKSNDNYIAWIELLMCIHYPSTGRNFIFKHGGIIFGRIGNVAIHC